MTEMAFEWLDESLIRIQEIADHLRLNIWVDTFQPALPRVIDHWENLIGTPLPKSYRDFFLKTNGLYIDYRSVIDRGEGDFLLGGNQLYILKIEHLIEVTSCQQQWRDETAVDDETPDELWKNLIICCDIGDGNYIVLDPDNSTISGEYRVCYAFHEYWPDTWRKDLVISESFEWFVKKIFDTIIIGHAIPVFWPVQLASPTSSNPLIAPGAEKYDWRKIDAVKDGKLIPCSNELAHPLTYGRLQSQRE